MAETPHITFDQRVELAWTNSGWMMDEMFNEGMCYFEGYIPKSDSTRFENFVSSLPDSADFSASVWAEGTTEDDWNRHYSRSEFVSFFQSGRIYSLHADYTAICSTFPFHLKVVFEREGNLEVIIYRENLLPRNETESRFFAACHQLRDLKEQFSGAALFLGPDTSNYPDWPNSVPNEWLRLL